VISTAKYFAPFALAAFQRAHPKTELRVMIGNRQQTVAALEAFDLDMAVMGYPPEHFPVGRAVIGDHPHVVVAPPGHPLAGRRALALGEVARERFLLREPGSGTRDLMRRLFDAEALSAGPRMEIGSNETIKQAVMAGMGMSFLSLRTVRNELAAGHLALVDIVGLPVVRQWYVTHLSAKRLSPAADALKHFLVEEAGPLVKAWA
jgi:LysR family transcriptional regulator for metE and metH